MNIRLFGTDAALALALGACMADDDPRPAMGAAAGRQCFYADSVTGFTPVGRDAVDVHVGPRRGYRLELAAGCEEVDWANRIAIRSRSGSSFVCSPFDAELVIPSTTGPGRCHVTAMRPLTEAELQARQRPREGR